MLFLSALLSMSRVAVVRKTTRPGLELALAGGRVVRVMAEVRPGHRFATRAVPAGELVLQYGQPIGTSLGWGWSFRSAAASCWTMTGWRTASM